MPPLTMAGLWAACRAEFGAARTPGKSAIHRFLSRVPGPKLTRRKALLDRDPECRFALTSALLPLVLH
jgi:hypothetical protein